jgi:hypothetical protein
VGFQVDLQAVVVDLRVDLRVDPLKGVGRYLAL